MNKSIIVFCPNPYSLYTNSVCELLIRKGYSIDTIVVRKFTFQRFKNEFSRDGKRLIKKIWKKLVLKDKAYSNDAENIKSFRSTNNLTITKVNDFKKYGVKLVYCESLNDKIVEETLKKHDEKLVVFTGGGIIRKNILDVAGDGIINCHMGILPKYKGMDLPEWCVLENCLDELGITLHFMDKGIDTGHILKMVKIPLGDIDNMKTLRNKFEPVMVNAMVETVDEYLKGKITPSQQPTHQKRQYFIVHEKLYQLMDKKLKKQQFS